MRVVDESVGGSGYPDVVMMLESGHVSGDSGTEGVAAAPGVLVREGIDDAVGGTVGTAGAVGMMNTADNVLLAGSDEGSPAFAQSWVE